ncbi:rod shape-determining protein MreC [Agriterribacter sp.]|uniref:rod shape-determining protein MreC n=1 Tax=Agriterribacter sp. TaxID=2821509 RepID=UPI002B860C69|nr:rod shape-determining protein MreC [Agriterribacter sp.]HRO46874.1 rod shape-determining protein MreC [Agriterribacter sp.]HRQ18211.1 rod shape-determining protein MreC [Agriterribacter sp.]
MRNVFLFVRRYFNFLFFIIMQAVALYMLFHYNRFHEAAFMSVAGEVTGKISKQYNTVEYYFQLKKTNALLVEENQTLRNLLKNDFLPADTTTEFVVDSIKVDSLERYRRYLYFPAKVINNSVTSQTNYLTISRGFNQGLSKDMAVVSPSGIIGTIVNVSANMATVMSLLHRQSRVSASLLKTGETGSVEWDGKDPQLLTFRNIPKSAVAKKGDTVITSRYSSFPPGQMIGIIEGVESQDGSNFYVLKIKPSTNFFNIQFVYAVKNLQKEEQDALEKATHKQE